MWPLRTPPGHRTARSSGRTPLRRALGAGAALAVTGLATLTLAAPAHAASGVWVSVNPSTITAGLQVGITGSCGENVNTASVSSGAFTSPVTLTPTNGILSATTVVPATTKAQGYTVALSCASGNAASTTLWVVNNATPSQGPATGGGGTAHRGGTVLAAGIAALFGSVAVGFSARRRRREWARL